MNKIVNALKEGKAFSGKNGAFTGRAQSIEGDTLKVVCDGMRIGNYSMLFGRLNVEIISSYE